MFPASFTIRAPQTSLPTAMRLLRPEAAGDKRRTPWLCHGLRVPVVTGQLDRLARLGPTMHQALRPLGGAGEAAQR